MRFPLPTSTPRVALQVAKLILIAVVVTAGSANAVTSGSWRFAGFMLHPRYGHTATLLKDGTVLIVGGVDTWPTPVGEAELFDPHSGAFLPAGRMFAPRWGHASVLLKDGRVLIVGGYSKPRDSSIDLALEATAEIFDPATRTFARAAQLPSDQTRWVASLIALPDGGALLLGGRCSGQFERFDPTASSFTPDAYTPFQQFVPPVVTASGRLILAGGGSCTGRGEFSTTMISSSDDYGENLSTIGQLNDSRMFHTATSFGGEQLLVAGGFARDFNPQMQAGTLASAEVVDAATGMSRRVGSLNQARSGHSAAPLKNGEVLLTGGESAVNGSNQVLSSTEIYDPVRETFHFVGSLNVARISAPLVVTADGRIFILGGSTDVGAVSSAEEFIPYPTRRRASKP